MSSTPWDAVEMKRATIIRQSKMAERIAVMWKWIEWTRREMERKPEDDMTRIARAYKEMKVSTDAATKARTKRARMNRKNWSVGGAGHEQ